MKEWLKVNFKINIPSNANKLIHLLQHEGYSAYVVGGCVRDSLLNRNPNDWDICTSATPTEMMAVFKDFQIIETGLQHGTITVVVDTDTYEVTTFRIDGEYTDNRRPNSVSFTNKLEEDLSRRDFTINAMAYNDEEGLIDPFNGLTDINEKVIRCVGDPLARFDEDALRVLRALRFACQLGFAIDFTTSMALFIKSPLLENISKERINVEFCKMVVTGCFSNIMLIYPCVFSQFIPELHDIICFDQKNPAHQYDVFTHTSKALQADSSADLVTRLALFFHDFGKPLCYQEDMDGTRHYEGHGRVGAEIVDSILAALKFDNKTRNAVTELVYYHDSTLEVDGANIKRWLNKLSVEQFKRLLSIRRADIKGSRQDYDIRRLEKVDKIEQQLNAILANGECFSLKELAINGNDLIALGCQAGKELGTILNALLQQVINGQLKNTKEILKNEAINIISQRS